jgi:hypothetical protein
MWKKHYFSSVFFTNVVWHGTYFLKVK